MALFDYLFNEGSGTSVAEDQQGGQALTLNGGQTWGSGNVRLEGQNSQYFSTPSGTYYDVDSFSIITWVSFNTSPGTNFKWFTALGNGSGGNNFSFGFVIDPTDLRFNFIVSNGSTNHLITPASGPAVTTSTKYLVVATYSRVGGAANNIAKIRYTSDGVTWYTATKTDTVLMQQNSGYSLRSDYNSGFHNLSLIDTNFWRMSLYTDQLLSDQDMQDIWDVGSEGDAPQCNCSVVGKIGVENSVIAVVSSDPATTGLVAEPGSLAVRNNSNTGQVWAKTGPGCLNWKELTLESDPGHTVFETNLYMSSAIAPLTSASSGTGAVVGFDPGGPGGEVGIATLESGTSAFSYSTLGLLEVPPVAGMKQILECRLKVGNLTSSSRDAYTFFSSGVYSLPAITDGIRIRYAGSVSANWAADAIVGSSLHTLTNLVNIEVVADVWYLLRIEITGAYSLVECFIDDLKFATIEDTSKFPAGGTATIPRVVTYNTTNGHTESTSIVDWIKITSKAA